MPSLSLDDNPDALQHLVRILGASVAVDVLRVLTEARHEDPKGGWLFLSDIATRIDQAPGTVSLAAQKLLPLLEEKRVKGKRYFRSRVREVKLDVELWDAPQDPLRAAGL